MQPVSELPDSLISWRFESPQFSRYLPGQEVRAGQVGQLGEVPKFREWSRLSSDSRTLVTRLGLPATVTPCYRRIYAPVQCGGSKRVFRCQQRHTVEHEAGVDCRVGHGETARRRGLDRRAVRVVVGADRCSTAYPSVGHQQGWCQNRCVRRIR